jgi:rhodanese-related sulfurtransferase
MVPEFDLVAFNFQPGELATLQTEFGWHVVNVVERSFVEPEMEPTELRKRIDAGDATASPPTLQLIDLRDDEELAQAPLLPGFRNLQYKDWQTWAAEAIEGKLEPPLDKALETVFMDHRGGRGERMMQYLCQNGFTSARFVRGGINAYAEEADPRVPTYLESDGDCTTCHEH